jgi:hypothetical protein
MPSKREKENARKCIHFEYLQIVNSAHRMAMKAVYDAVSDWVGGDPESLGVDPFQWGPLPGEICGGATVSVDGRSRFGRWAIKNVGWTRGYPRGARLGIDTFGPCENRKAIYVSAFAKCLNDAGINASWERHSC